MRKLIASLSHLEAREKTNQAEKSRLDSTMDGVYGEESLGRMVGMQAEMTEHEWYPRGYHPFIERWDWENDGIGIEKL